jgi:hypothetical protein
LFLLAFGLLLILMIYREHLRTPTSDNWCDVSSERKQCFSLTTELMKQVLSTVLPKINSTEDTNSLCSTSSLRQWLGYLVHSRSCYS